MEIWKDIVGYEGLYQVSDQGNVKSLGRIVKKTKGLTTYDYKTKEIIIKQDTSSPYNRVRLHKGSETTSGMVHRLMMIAFVRNTDNKSQVNHIDGNKRHNELYNLEWCTQSENMSHAYMTGLQKPKTGEESVSSKLIESEVKIIRELCEEKIYTQKSIGAMFGVTRTAINAIHTRRNWKYI